jgi:DNA-directed RNA polymerase specialized sigma24 family protein
MDKLNAMKTSQQNFDALIARNYPAVYSFASRLTDDPRDAIVLTRAAFNVARKQLRKLRDQTAIATVLLSAVIRAGLTTA